MQTRATPSQGNAGRGGVFALIVLVVVGTLNFVDRQILSVLIEPIRAELHFSDSQFGLLTGLAFSLFYGVFGLPAALMADRWNRIRLIAIACAIWSGFTAAMGSVRGFTAMAFVRFGVGVGEAGGTAPSLSVLADYFPRERRPLVIGLFTLNGPVGVFAGAAFGGWAAAHIGWRAAFELLGVIGLVAAIFLWLTVREPGRGHFDAEATPPQPVSLGETLKLFVANPGLRQVSIASGASAFLSYGMLNWIPAFLMRVQHMPLSAIGQWFAPAAGITMGVGMVGGGALVNWWVRRSIRGYAMVPAICTAILIPLFGAAVFIGDWRVSLALMLIPMAACTVFTPASLALAQELGPRSARATVSATLLLMFNIVGLGLGPLFVGVLSDALKASQGVESLRIALGLLLVPAAFASFAHWRLAGILSKGQQSAAPHPISPDIATGIIDANA
ncbi:MAG TPA: MFS transporter [Sphingomonas sp.]